MSDRDNKGRFKPGNTVSKGNGGNPQLKRLAEHRRAIKAAVSGEDLRALLRSLYDRALEGDIQAARVVFERALGKPREEPAQMELDLPELTDADSVVEASRRILVALTSGEIDAGSAMAAAAMVRDFRENVLVADVLDRVKALEAGTGDTQRFHAARAPERHVID